MGSKLPKVGMAVVIWKDSKCLFLQRKGSHGEGSWATPGRHLEFGESWEDCAKREVREEVGVEITNVRLLAATNDIYPPEDRHYVTLWIESDLLSGEPKIMEPEKCAAIQWVSFKDLPKPTFPPYYDNLRKVRPDLFE